LCFSGRGATTIWQDGGRRQTFEWARARLFSPPLNARYQHFNGQGDKRCAFGDDQRADRAESLSQRRFCFNCDYRFTDRYAGEDDFFSGQRGFPRGLSHDTNFIRDVRSYELPERRIPVRVVSDHDRDVKHVMSAHISQFPVGDLQKAHRHAPART